MRSAVVRNSRPKLVKVIALKRQLMHPGQCFYTCVYVHIERGHQGRNLGEGAAFHTLAKDMSKNRGETH